MGKEQVAKTGRPSGYSEEVVGTICQEIMAGKSLRTICAMEGMPAASTVYAWLGQYQEFSDMYARARELQADSVPETAAAVCVRPRARVASRRAGR